MFSIFLRENKASKVHLTVSSPHDEQVPDVGVDSSVLSEEDDNHDLVDGGTVFVEDDP